MPVTKIPSQASVRRALTTLRKFGAIKETSTDFTLGYSSVILQLDNSLMSPKKTSRKKPKHKKVKPEKIFREGVEKTSNNDAYGDYDPTIIDTSDGGLYNNHLQDIYGHDDQ